ncbi:hypothetical protein [Pedobacter sp. Leaf132]|uniref:hypothetical protein n=1 Tax=Pedobacter sp. Leaf132 TaxID=2876557 RepID=UPI001E386DF6|nr:hypothetical protein [Pedobacter sp. Leaf132]
MKANTTPKTPINYLVNSLAKSRTLKRTIGPGFSIINSLMRANFTKKGSTPFSLQRNIEFGAAGAIAAYNLYKGIKKHKKHLVFQAAMIGIAITGLLILSAAEKNKVAENSIKA